MRDEQQKQQARRQEEDEAALERERLGGPADYDEAGGTGLSGETAGRGGDEGRGGNDAALRDADAPRGNR
jgi:hypothetical protein